MAMTMTAQTMMHIKTVGAADCFHGQIQAVITRSKSWLHTSVCDIRTTMSFKGSEFKLRDLPGAHSRMLGANKRQVKVA